ncbi:TauD/TfdA family dioxygenase [Photobacterium sp. WH77]|uniref:TauD/TfdA family dioxygenase n=1 Tax=Photobacterium arenosum TaxID=2774143 RepID=A0ABR9BM48_9GAMM|nr:MULTISPECIES: TauD/TfdA family dioxygenase [Photobacterium]MBD8513640.1 TauD/TfdA family dioxygenase [Photobacterium arenosum]MCG2838014.1 TauD/TfdA family dioxygenase [Photobacterium sp. WH77]MCG2845632.1 TauD/TfdA family dioxygenase [Photobacterium sp. WH80]MDO6583660.1 TauD/TfdA family dioxygenase [Photobacterium sp. 2_MG-2023]
MKPFYIFSDNEKKILFDLLNKISVSPYDSYSEFKNKIQSMVRNGCIPWFYVDICKNILEERKNGICEVHVLRNCPIDGEIPELDLNDPVKDKYIKKRTFISESLLELTAILTETPLLSYCDRNDGCFFTDVVARNKYKGKLTGYSDSELVYHNDRTAHKVRADYVTLLGLRCPDGEVTYTGFVHYKDIFSLLSENIIKILKKDYFVTDFDIFSKETNQKNISSEKHPIILDDNSIRYMDTMTSVAEDSPEEAKDALIAFIHALTRADKVKHRIVEGDLLTFSNQYGLHSREKFEVNENESVSSRWLQKTYAFKDKTVADKFSDYWVNDTYGLVAD